VVLTGAVALVAASGAGAANQRVAISDYRWSKPDIHLDLGEHVTWYWTGPDTMHSVTGISGSAAGLDSDPGVSMPNHPVGDSFRLAFDQPGVYSFHCKLHSSVRGTIEVSNEPGDPVGEPDPIPADNVDVRPPGLSELRLARTVFARGEGRLHLALDERATIDAEYWRLRRGRGGRSYQGWQQWAGHIGYNDVRFAAGPRFRARPGRYVAIIDATDADNNSTRSYRLSFQLRR
jgi:plastocyanin